MTPTTQFRELKEERSSEWLHSHHALRPAETYLREPCWWRGAPGARPEGAAPDPSWPHHTGQSRSGQISHRATDHLYTSVLTTRRRRRRRPSNLLECSVAPTNKNGPVRSPVGRPLVLIKAGERKAAGAVTWCLAPPPGVDRRRHKMGARRRRRRSAPGANRGRAARAGLGRRQ